MFICCSSKPKRVQDWSKKRSSLQKVQEKSSPKYEMRSNGSVLQSTQQTFPQNEPLDQQLQKFRNYMLFRDPIETQLTYIRELTGKNLAKRLKTESELISSIINDVTLPDIYILDFKWAQAYTAYLKGAKTIVEPINNANLLADPQLKKEFTQYDLRHGLKRDKDFVLLNQKAWSVITRLYGGGPEIIQTDKPYQPLQSSGKPPLKPRMAESDLKSQTTVDRQTTRSEIQHDPNRYVSTIQVNIKKAEHSSSIGATERNNEQSIKELDDTRSKYQIVGLHNQRFYCYMNAALQCILSIPELNDRLYSLKIHKPYINAYQDLLRKIQSVSGRRIPVIQATSIQNICSHKFQFHQQQDSHEFLLHFLQQMQEELVGKYKGKEFKSSEQAWKDYMEKNNDIIDQTFAGQITSRSHCKSCGKVSEGYDPMWDLSIAINKSWLGSDFQLTDCLKSHFKEEVINDKWKCDQCKIVNSSVRRTLEITQTPKILIIQFKRFSVYPKKEKINSSAFYPEELDLKNFCSQNQKSQYRLKALISHMGQINGGHYVSRARINNHWYLFDDDAVSNIKQFIPDRQAYVLFYEKI